MPKDHPLASRLASISSHVSASESIVGVDNPPNRFVKYALTSFDVFLKRVYEAATRLPGDTQARFLDEVVRVRSRLAAALRAELFRRVGRLSSIPGSDMTLQHRDGYREIYQAWLRFGRAARIQWTSSCESYRAGQRHAASLYEYWVFFRLLELVTEVCRFDKPAALDLLTLGPGGFALKLRHGTTVGVAGTASRGGGQLRLRFQYNRTFLPRTDFRQSGTWSRRMRPDYTLSMWPVGQSEAEAESRQTIVHIHFDAKYRADGIGELFGRSEIAFSEDEAIAGRELEEEASGGGRYKRADLLKMHAYRDAIRRSYGAFVIYPGRLSERWSEYHELLPGVGAFTMRPGGNASAIATFIGELMDHVLDQNTARARSARAAASFRT